jgi:hypothetical protein
MNAMSGPRPQSTKENAMSRHTLAHRWTPILALAAAGTLASCGGGGGDGMGAMPTQAVASQPAAMPSASTSAMPAAQPMPSPDATTLSQMGGAP